MIHRFKEGFQKEWFKHPKCDTCGRFAGVGGCYDTDEGVDGMGPTTIDGVWCKACAEDEGISPFFEEAPNE